MATALTKCRVNANIDFLQVDNTAGVNTTAGGVIGLNQGNTLQFSIGTNTINSLNQAYYPAVITLAGGASTTINLIDTANKTPTNVSLTLARSKILEVSAVGVNTTNFINGVLVNSLATNAALNVGGTVPPGGTLMWINPTANGNTVNTVFKFLKLENLDATNSVYVTVFVGGSNA